MKLSALFPDDKQIKSVNIFEDNKFSFVPKTGELLLSLLSGKQTIDNDLELADTEYRVLHHLGCTAVYISKLKLLDMDCKLAK
jgi:hypothetical protein